MPAGLVGCYVRNGPNPFFQLEKTPEGKWQPYHFFDGDGFLHQITLYSNKPPEYCGNWVKTTQFHENKVEGRAVHPIGENLAGNPVPMMDILYPERSPKYTVMKGTANTSVVYHGGRLLALHEGDAPYEVDPSSLATRGRFTWGGQLQHRFTAHPSVCPRTGDMMFFGANPIGADGVYMHYSVAGPDGTLRVNGAAVHGIRNAIVLHDIAITNKYSIVLDLPLVINPGATPPYHHDLDAPARFGVMPRLFKGGKEASATQIRWFEATSCFVYHMANAWESEDGRSITLVGCRSPKMDLGLGSSVWRLHEWVIDLESGAVAERQLSGRQVEFPMVAPWRIGQPTRYVYAVNFQPSSPASFDAVIKFDLKTGAEVCHKLQPDINASEFVLASSRPRSWRDADSDEDVFLLSFVHSISGSQEAVQSRNSSFYVVRASDMVCQAIVGLPVRVPFGFHGTFYRTGPKLVEAGARPQSRL